jgi:hypothetical protein
MSDSDTPTVVSATQMLALPRNGELQKRAASPEMVVDWPLQVP